MRRTLSTRLPGWLENQAAVACSCSRMLVNPWRVQDLHHIAELGLDLLQIFIPDGDRGGEVAEGHDIGADFLPRGVGIHGLIGGRAVDHARGLLADDFDELRPQRLFLAEPVTLRFLQ